jgi:hypothetical protein
LFVPCCALGRKPAPPCGIAGFTPSPLEHIVDEIERPFFVCAVKGRLRSEGGDWPTEWPILFEIRRTGKAAKTMRTYADPEGYFEIPGVAEGLYCFKATVSGWRSVMGQIKVSKKAGPQNTISIIMKVGV